MSSNRHLWYENITRRHKGAKIDFVISAPAIDFDLEDYHQWLDQCSRICPPVHPRETLREEVLPALGRPKTEIASLLSLSRQTLYDILNKREPDTAKMAMRIGKLLGHGPEIRLKMQGRYDLKIAEHELGDALDKKLELKAA